MKSSGMSSRSELERVMDAARSPGWTFGLGRGGEVMATRDSGDIGLPWVVLARRAGRGLAVSLFHPGDDVTAEGEVIGELSGNAREMGRQLRTLLGDLDLAR